jgi:hypothetical protein
MRTANAALTKRRHWASLAGARSSSPSRASEALRVTKRRQASSEQAWATAKTLCRLSARQVEMAQALGMNPRWLQHGTIPPEVLTEVRDELRDIVHALDTGAAIPELPAISVPPDRERAAPGRRGRGLPFGDDDDDPPF